MPPPRTSERLCRGLGRDPPPGAWHCRFPPGCSDLEGSGNEGDEGAAADFDAELEAASDSDAEELAGESGSEEEGGSGSKGEEEGGSGSDGEQDGQPSADAAAASEEGGSEEEDGFDLDEALAEAESDSGSDDK